MTADIFLGNFTNQPLVFAHLWDLAGGDYNAEGVEVICNADPTLRIRHYFCEIDARQIEDALGLNTTCVIIFATANLDLGTENTELLRYVGSFPTLRLAPGQ